MLLAIVWMDNARDLSRSFPGPWCPQNRMRAWTTYMFPIIQHREYLALSNTSPNTEVSSSPEPTQSWEANQNACLLPFQYGQFLNKSTMADDALYALSDVFRLSATSEGQFLNLVHEQIEHELEVSRHANPTNASMLNLRYLRGILENHITKLTEIVLFLKNHDQIPWPRPPPESSERVEADRMQNTLLNDFSHLHRRLERLSRSCHEGMQSLANSAAFQESAKAVANATRVECLTLLATIFVPLSFTSSAFGMNFSVFGQGAQSMGLFPRRCSSHGDFISHMVQCYTAYR